MKESRDADPPFLRGIAERPGVSSRMGSGFGVSVRLGLPRDAYSRSSERDTNANRDANPKPEVTGARVVC